MKPGPELVTRKLAAVLVADAADFSRLMGMDELGTLARLKAIRAQIIEPEVKARQGRIVKEMGDGFLIEFPSIVDAVQCAVEIQSALQNGVTKGPSKSNIRLRIGINLGDVIVEDDDIFGEGVNIAARLEAISPVGGICVSGKVYDEVIGRVEQPFEYLGEKVLKNIAVPVRVYATPDNAASKSPYPADKTTDSDAIARGNSAYDRRDWADAYRYFVAAHEASVLHADDLDRFATVAYLLGNESEARETWTRAHSALVCRGSEGSAARIGFWLSLNYLLSGEMAQCTGWLARSERLLKDHKEPCAEQGHGCIVSGLLAMGKGDFVSAKAEFDKALALAERYNDSDLTALSLLSQGQILVQLNQISEGISRLDEAMVAITTSKVSPALAGIIYCAVILTCHHVFDLSRAREWTELLDGWCASQPDLVPYRGQCLVHRSEILQLRGDWSAAVAEATSARQHLAGKSEAVVGRACYQQGELHRLSGEIKQAEEMYRAADQYGCEPQPGISLLLLAKGQPDTAASAIRSVVEMTGAGASRAKLLGPFAEILLANGDLNGACSAASELTEIASELDAPFLKATSEHTAGAVLLAENKPKEALVRLRDALAIWHGLEMPYEAARTRVLIGRAYRRIGDHTTGEMHTDAAKATFKHLGAKPALMQLEMLSE